MNQRNFALHIHIKCLECKAFQILNINNNKCKKTYQFKIHCKDDVMISLH